MVECTLTPILFHTQIGGHAHSLSHSLTHSLTDLPLSRTEWSAHSLSDSPRFTHLQISQNGMQTHSLSGIPLSQTD